MLLLSRLDVESLPVLKRIKRPKRLENLEWENANHNSLVRRDFDNW